MPHNVLVTGCSTGIGLATARLLAERGVHVFATVRNDADAARLARINGVEPVICDVTDDVNVFGVHRVTNALVDLITASRGRIVTMSSIAGTLSSTLLGAYSMSKHALEAYTDSLAKQLAPLGVHVCAVAPGNFASAISRNAVTRFAPPPEWARLNASTPYAWSAVRLVAEIEAQMDAATSARRSDGAEPS